MAITIQIGNCGDDNRVVDKTVAFDSLEGDIVFRDIAELHSPEFTVGSSLSADINYCSISGVDDSTRYYFAEVINERTGYSRVICRLDVLMTYKEAILNTDCVCKRTANMNYQCQYIVDGKAPIEARHNVSQIENATELAHLSQYLILCTVG